LTRNAYAGNNASVISLFYIAYTSKNIQICNALDHNLLRLRVAKYCDEHVCVCVCLSGRISPGPHARYIPNVLWMLPIAVARSSSGVVAVRCVGLLLVLWMTSCFSSTMGRITDRFCLNLLIYRKVGQNSISYY